LRDSLFIRLVTGFPSDRDRPTELVRCPVHGFIHYSENEKEIIDHPVFQRLRNIRQLALTYYLYPGAMHSRFEHSLGVMEMATRSFESISLKNKKLIVGELSQIPELKRGTWERARQTLRMFALLHDVGHPAFSHAAEDVIPNGSHESVSQYAVDKILRPKLEELFFRGITDLIVRVVHPARTGHGS